MLSSGVEVYLGGTENSSSDSNLYYLQSRYYDSTIGRFINADDISYLDPESLNGLNLYAYCGNNAVMAVDPSGKFFFSFLIGLGIAALTFAVVNTGAQLVGDLINYVATGEWNSGWEEYVGAFTGGLAGGATFFLTHGNLAATFAVMGGVETLSTSLITNATGRTNYNGGQVLMKTAFSVGIGVVSGGLFGGTQKIGITAGRNSFMSVWKSGLTKLSHGTAGIMSTGVMMKGLAGVAVMRSKAAVLGGIFSSGLDWVYYLFGNWKGIGYII